MRKDAARCSICGAAPTVRSHLIPRAFVLDIRGDDTDAVLTDRDRPGHRLVKGGTYSRDIFCATHEAVTGQLDSAAVKFCRAVYEGPRLQAGGAFQVCGVDAGTLIRFACSILFRCHLSRRDEVRLVDVGGYANNLAEVVFDNYLQKAPHVYIYSAVSTEIDFRELGSLPASVVVDLYPRWSFQVGGMAFVIDLGRPEPAFPHSLLRPGYPIWGPVFSFEDTTLATSWRSLMEKGNR